MKRHEKERGHTPQASALPPKADVSSSKPSRSPDSNSIFLNPFSLVLVLRSISGKWKLPILCHLFSGTKRFNELRRLTPGIGRAMLSFELNQLRKDGLIDRTQYETIPPTVEYSLTAKGRGLKQALLALERWIEETSINEPRVS